MEKIIYLVNATESSDIDYIQTLPIASFESETQAKSYIDNFNDIEFKKCIENHLLPNFWDEWQGKARMVCQRHTSSGLEFNLETLWEDGVWNLEFAEYRLWISSVPFYS